MNREILDRLSVITEEEQEILSGRQGIDPTRYTEKKELVIDSGKMLEHGKLIRIRPHTRFVHFPKHRHNYVEVIYMCQGQTTHIIDGNQVVLQAGELLFLNQNAIQEIQNLVENMVWTLLNNQPNKRSINQVTMGLLFLHLMHHTDRIRSASSSFDQQLIFQVLKFIDENYRDGQLTDLAAQLGYEIPWLSRAIKRLLGRTYKELLQIKRLNQAAFLLQSTRLPITDICAAVGYDNTSYFHRIFREYYHMSPKEYRCQGN